MNKEIFLKRVVYFFMFFTTIFYIIYRIFYTLPFNYRVIDIVFGILVLFFEILEAIDFIIYYFNILRYSKKNPVAKKISKNDYLDVDVFIATINEEEELLEKTILACKKMKYPKKNKVHIYMCDDGNRNFVRELALKHKIGYISRDSNENAKAGNYNNALKLTNSPLIVTFDADMKPTPYFLLKVVPYIISDNNIGFVQIPQSFENPDIFQLRYKLYDKIPFEQDYFYKNIQLAKNNTNSVIYCGTNTIIRREAIEKIGGFATNTITEDIATGMLIEMEGYKGIALSDNEAYGVAVNDINSFIRQRTRWSRGCIQVLKRYNILFNKKLTFRQKLDYLECCDYWFFGIKRIFYLIIPLLFSLFGISIISSNIYLFISVFFTQYILKRFFIDLLEDNKKSSTWSKIYELSVAPIIAKEVIKELFSIDKKEFEVTSKKNNNKKNINKELVLSHSLLLILSILGLILSFYKSTILGIDKYIISIVWLAINVCYLIIVLIFDLQKKYVYPKNFTPNKTSNYSITNIISRRKNEKNV